MTLIITIFSFWVQWDFRWYGPAILILILAFLGLWAILKPKKMKDQINPIKVLLKAILILLLVFIAMIPAIVFPRYERLSPTGPYPIETQKFSLVDQSRDELFTSSQDYRKLEVAFLFPKSKRHELNSIQFRKIIPEVLQYTSVT